MGLLKILRKWKWLDDTIKGECQFDFYQKKYPSIDQKVSNPSQDVSDVLESTLIQENSQPINAERESAIEAAIKESSLEATVEDVPINGEYLIKEFKETNGSAYPLGEKAERFNLFLDNVFDFFTPQKRYRIDPISLGFHLKNAIKDSTTRLKYLKPKQVEDYATALNEIGIKRNGKNYYLNEEKLELPFFHGIAVAYQKAKELELTELKKEFRENLLEAKERVGSETLKDILREAEGYSLAVEGKGPWKNAPWLHLYKIKNIILKPVPIQNREPLEINRQAEPLLQY